MDKAQIDILLATYNAEKYLKEQLDSITSQDHNNWQIIISDDGSNDDTLNIIKSYIASYPTKITLLPFKNNRGAKANFNYLLQNSNADYISFSDHDDVWLPDKLSTSLKAILEIESRNGKEKPALAFTDKSVTDEKLRIIHKSSNDAEHFNSKKIKLNSLLVQNVASGCTMMINKKLKTLTGSIPEIAMMHDYYMILIAKIFGEIVYIDRPTMLYRQHSQNEIGAVSYNIKYILSRIKQGRKKLREDFVKHINQAEYILNNYKDIDNESLKILNDFIKLNDFSFFKFRYKLICGGYFKSGCVRKLGMMVLL